MGENVKVLAAFCDSERDGAKCDICDKICLLNMEIPAFQGSIIIYDINLHASLSLQK